MAAGAWCDGSFFAANRNFAGVPPPLPIFSGSAFFSGFSSVTGADGAAGAAGGAVTTGASGCCSGVCAAGGVAGAGSAGAATGGAAGTGAGAGETDGAAVGGAGEGAGASFGPGSSIVGGFAAGAALSSELCCARMISPNSLALTVGAPAAITKPQMNAMVRRTNITQSMYRALCRLSGKNTGAVKHAAVLCSMFSAALAVNHSFTSAAAVREDHHTG